MDRILTRHGEKKGKGFKVGGTRGEGKPSQKPRANLVASDALARKRNTIMMNPPSPSILKGKKGKGGKRTSRERGKLLKREGKKDIRLFLLRHGVRSRGEMLLSYRDKQAPRRKDGRKAMWNQRSTSETPGGERKVAAASFIDMARQKMKKKKRVFQKKKKKGKHLRRVVRRSKERRKES